MHLGLVNFVFAWPAIWTIDTFGRRTLLLFTFPQMVSQSPHSLPNKLITH
jgi:hypothetical protein